MGRTHAGRGERGERGEQEDTCRVGGEEGEGGAGRTHAGRGERGGCMQGGGEGHMQDANQRQPAEDTRCKP